MKKTFSINARLSSFANAFRGMFVYIRQEHNAWIHCVIAVLVVIAGILFRISLTEWLTVIFAIGLVLAAEAFNSSIERISDVVQPEKDERIRDVDQESSLFSPLLCCPRCYGPAATRSGGEICLSLLKPLTQILKW